MIGHQTHLKENEDLTLLDSPLIEARREKKKFFGDRSPPYLRVWNPESFQFLLCNLESWPLESRMQLKEFGIKVRIGIQNPSSTDEESGFQYLES